MKKSSEKAPQPPATKKKGLYQKGLLIGVLVAGFTLGWMVKTTAQAPTPASASKSSCLRGNGLAFVSPLLLCDTSAKVNSPELDSLQSKFKDIISAAQSAHDVDDVSIFFRDLTTRTQTSVNGQEQYFPASLNKVPLLMAYYQEAESDPSVLSKTIKVGGPTDFNTGIEIQPSAVAKPGETHTVEELINFMIKGSDNNSFEALANDIDPEKLKAVFKELQIQYPTDEASITDFITPYQYSLFLRTLYNGTILNQDYSEQALKLMSQVDFKDGLVAGVPSDVTVAHKFGIGTHNDNLGNLIQRELHDCGIVYDNKSPYLLCVMTKGSTTLQQAEKTIKDISATAYQAVENGYK